MPVSVPQDGSKKEGEEDKKPSEEASQPKCDGDQPSKEDEQNDSASHDPYYPPVISLPEVEVDSGENEEDVLFKMRAKLFRYDSCADPPEWKERGTGDVKLLKHKETGGTRLLMRRDKTLKACANHSLLPWMQLRPNRGSPDRAFVWSVQADFGDGTGPDGRPELLAIRFANSSNASAFKQKFDECVREATSKEAAKLKEEEEAELAAAVEEKAKV